MIAPPATTCRLRGHRLLGALAVGLATAALGGFGTARTSQAVAPDWTIPLVLHALQNIALVALSFLATGWGASVDF